MDNQYFKEKLYSYCIQKQKEKAENAKEAMNETQTAANEYGPPKDRYDSFRTQLLRKRDLYAQQYEFALNELTILQKINPKEKKQQAEFGAMVFMDKQILFIATGLGKIQLEDKDVFVISPLVPLFHVLKGLKKGDVYTFNKNSFTILDVL